jgi:adenylate kinase family enzyme
MVILIAGPGGAGKSTTAARIARHPDWVHLSEDDHWVDVKHGRPVGELRTAAEQDVVHERVVAQVHELVGGGRSVALELILYEDPPRPLLRYQAALGAARIPFTTRILRPSVDEIVRRIRTRARPIDRDLDQVRRTVARQVRVLSSPHVDVAWVLDSTGLTPEELYVTHFASIVEA